MPWPQTGATKYHPQLRLPDNGRAIKGMVVCNNWDLDTLDLLNGLALGCYQSYQQTFVIMTDQKLTSKMAQLNLRLITDSKKGESN